MSSADQPVVDGLDDDGADDPTVDGRTARRDRNRDAVLDAVIDLFTEGQLLPGANEVAERSGVSPRSVYRYFEDAEALTRAAIARNLELVAPLFHMPGIGEGPLDDRIDRFVIARMRLWHAAGATARVAAFHAATNPLIRERYDITRSDLRDQVSHMFAPELDDLDVAERRAVHGAIDALCEFSGLDHLCRVRGLSDGQARDILARALRRLLAP